MSSNTSFSDSIIDHVCETNGYLLETVTENIKKNKSKKTTKSSNMCPYVKRFQHKELAWESLEKGKPIYVMTTKEKEGKGSNTYVAYGSCSFTCVKGEDCCARHKSKSKTFILLEDLLQNEKIQKIDSPNAKHPYFTTMGTRGAKKRNIDTKYDFTNENEINIFNILSGPNPILKKMLIDCANHITTNQTSIMKNHSTTYKIKPKSTSASNSAVDSNLLETTSTTESNLSILLSKKDNDNVNSKLTSTHEIVDEKSNSNSKPKSLDTDDEVSDCGEDNEEEEEEEEEDDDEEEEETDDSNFVELTLKEGDDKYYLNPETNDVYQIVEESYQEVGQLVEFPEKYSKLTYDEKHYIIAKEIDDEETDKELYLCVLSNYVFNRSDNKRVGKIKTSKNGDITITYNEDKKSKK
jgi:hypothetical protein